jgi:hypothetical protein
MQRGRDASLELAYAASDAYEHEDANLAVIDEVLDHLFARADVAELDAVALRRDLRFVLATNRTAPGCMRMMAQADELRTANAHVQAASGRRERQIWRKHARKVHAELTQQVATTLDALLAESR